MNATVQTKERANKKTERRANKSLGIRARERVKEREVLIVKKHAFKATKESSRLAVGYSSEPSIDDQLKNWKPKKHTVSEDTMQLINILM